MREQVRDWRAGHDFGQSPPFKLGELLDAIPRMVLQSQSAIHNTRGTKTALTPPSFIKLTTYR